MSLRAVLAAARRVAIRFVAVVVVATAVLSAVSWWRNRPVLGQSAVRVGVSFAPLDPAGTHDPAAAPLAATDRGFTVDLAVDADKPAGSLLIVITDRRNAALATLAAPDDDRLVSFSMDPPPTRWLRGLGTVVSQIQAYRIPVAAHTASHLVAIFHADPGVGLSDLAVGVLFFNPNGRYKWAKEVAPSYRV